MKTSLLSPDTTNSQLVYSEAEGFLKSALDAMSAHIAILDENGIILDVNAAWRDFAIVNNFTHSAYGIGLNYLTVCDNATPVSGDAYQVGQGIRSVMGHTLNEFYLEYPCHSPTERRWYVVRVTRFDWYGRVRLIVAHQNVTELKQVQIQLEESKAHIQAILDNVVDGIITLDEYGNIETVNPAAAHIFGYELLEMVGQNVEVLFHSQKRRALNDLLVDTNRMGHETVGQRKDGSYFPMYIAMTHVTVGNRTMYTGIVQDITMRKQLEAEQLEKERLGVALEKERELRLLKDRFISVMSHELRTPLASIQLASDMLRKYGDRSTEEEKQDSLEAIETQVRHLSEMVKDVLTISKTEFMAQDINLEVYDLETYLRDILEELARTYGKTHKLVFDGLNRRIEVRIDRKLLRHAFVNLLANAVKYSPEGSQICLRLSSDSQEAIVEIADQGIGIPEEDIPRLFDAFHRAGNVEQYQGTGLGLAIAKQAIELHGGSISVQSHLGVGTTFIVRLPLI